MEGEAEGSQWLSDYVIGVLRSPTWVLPIAQFVDERCDLFDDREEHTFEQTASHNDFKQLVNTLLESHLMEVSVTPEEFELFCETGFAQDQRLHRALVEQLLAVDDFLSFKAMMAKHNAELMREVVTFDVEDDDGVGVHGSPTQAVVESVVASCITSGMLSSGEDWHLYQEYEDQLQVALMASREDEEGIDAQWRCEEASLQQAIALSLQLEEERLRQLTGDPEEPMAAEAPPEQVPDVPPGVGFISAPLCALPKPKVEVVPQYVALDPLTPRVKKAWGFTSAPLVPIPAPISPTSAMTPPPLPAPANTPEASPFLVASSPLCVRLPKQQVLPPLRGAPVAVLPTPRVEEMRANLSQWRERAESAIMAPEVPRPAAQRSSLQAPQAGPSEEERRQRAEHLKRQRDRLLQKRSLERQRQLTEFQQHKSAQAAASSIDSAALAERATAGSRLSAELAPEAAAAGHQLADGPASAERMRQAVTLQLRSSLMRSMASDATVLNAQLSQLESRRHGP